MLNITPTTPPLSRWGVIEQCNATRIGWAWGVETHTTERATSKFQKKHFASVCEKPNTPSLSMMRSHARIEGCDGGGGGFHPPPAIQATASL